MSPLNESFINYLKTSHIEKELNEWIFHLAVQKGKKVYANISIYIWTNEIHSNRWKNWNRWVTIQTRNLDYLRKYWLGSVATMWALGPKKENKLAREVGWMDVIQDPLNSVCIHRWSSWVAVNSYGIIDSPPIYI